MTPPPRRPNPPNLSPVGAAVPYVSVRGCGKPMSPTAWGALSRGSFVSKYESGERRLDVVELRELCRVLGTSLTAFVRRLDATLDKQHR